MEEGGCGFMDAVRGGLTCTLGTEIRVQISLNIGGR